MLISINHLSLYLHWWYFSPFFSFLFHIWISSIKFFKVRKCYLQKHLFLFNLYLYNFNWLEWDGAFSLLWIFLTYWDGIYMIYTIRPAFTAWTAAYEFWYCFPLKLVGAFISGTEDHTLNITYDLTIYDFSVRCNEYVLSSR